MNPLVSIVTVCFNSQKTISQTLESVLNQSYDNIEYIVVDGDSSDNTVEIVRRQEKAFMQKGYTLKIVSEPDKGIYDAMNKGVHISSGELIGIINSDDWYEQDAIAQVVEAYKNDKFDVIYGDLLVHKQSGSFVKRAQLRRILSTRHWNHPTTFITREVYKEYRYSLESGIYADLDLILKLRKAGKKFVILNRVLANFRFGGISNKKSFSHTMERVWLRYTIYRKNGFSRFYLFDCFIVEFAKYLAA